MLRFVFCSVIAVFSLAASASAAVSTYFDYAQWQSMVGDYSTVDFTGFADGTPISNQYEDLGVNVTSVSFIFETGFFANDGWGLHGPSGLRFHFDSPQNWVAVDYPGAVRLNLFLNSELVYMSPFFQPGGIGNFVGLISTIPFDEVYIDKGPPGPFDVFIDDLHWGGVPAPGALALFALSALCRSRRRRS